MAGSENIDQIISLYWEPGRASVQKQYDALFNREEGSPQPDSPDAEEAPTAEVHGSEEELGPFDDKALESDLEDNFKALRLTPDIAQKAKDRWQNLNPSGKVVALHQLDCAGTEWCSNVYQTEGLLMFFDEHIASHIMHQWFPDKVFPIYSHGDLDYNQMRMIFRILGIQCKDNEDRLPFEILLDIGEAAEAFRVRHKLEPWQVWSLVYDLGPRLLPPPAPYPQENPPRIWVVAGNEPGGDFETVDKDTATDLHGWTINQKARRGDLALMYLLRPRSAIVAVYRCASDAFRDPFMNYWTGHRVQITDKISIPWLTIKDMRADPILCDWAMVKCSFNNCLRLEVSPTIWNRIKELIQAKDSKIGGDLDQYVVATSGVRMIVEDGLSEEEFENRTVVPLLERLGWDMARTVRRQHEMDVKVGSGRPKRVRADFVGYRDALGSDVLLVIESKRHVRSDSELSIAVEQCESYAGKLRCGRFAVAAPEGFWVFDLKFPGQSEKRTFVPINAGRDNETIEKLKPLIGYAFLRDAQSD